MLDKNRLRQATTHNKANDVAILLQKIPRLVDDCYEEAVEAVLFNHVACVAHFCQHAHEMLVRQNRQCPWAEAALVEAAVRNHHQCAMLVLPLVSKHQMRRAFSVCVSRQHNDLLVDLLARHPPKNGVWANGVWEVLIKDMSLWNNTEALSKIRTLCNPVQILASNPSTQNTKLHDWVVRVLTAMDRHEMSNAVNDTTAPPKCPRKM